MKTYLLPTIIVKVQRGLPTPSTTEVRETICDHCAEAYLRSLHWPFANLCQPCMLDLVYDLAHLVDDGLTQDDPYYSQYLPSMDPPHCPLCHQTTTTTP